jgi:hypothetical protein
MGVMRSSDYGGLSQGYFPETTSRPLTAKS